MIAMMLLVMIGLLLLGFPMMIPMIAASIIVIVFFMPTDPSFLVQQMMTGISAYELLAVPLFILAADIMSEGKTSKRLLDFVGAFVGHIRGGYAITTAITCALFGSISGSTQATVVAVGRPMRQRLLKAGYKDSSAIALIINASDVALLIPPSIGLIIYALAAPNVSLGDLFIAGIGPGLLVLLMFVIYSYIHAKIFKIPLDEKVPWKKRGQVTLKALLPLGFPVIIIGGIYGGLFTATEAAGISVLYALILELFIFRTIKLSMIPKLALSTGLVTSAVFILVAAGQALSWILVMERVPQMLTGAVLGDNPSALYVLFIVAIFFFIGCMFVDPIVVILILTPIFYPAAIAAGVDPIHLGIVIVFQAALGSATPPFGVDIFTASAVFNKSYLNVIRGTPPFIIMLIVAAVIIILFEEISLFLL